MVGTAGHDSLLGYLWEDNGFRASPTDTDLKPFGRDANMTTKEESNNAVRLFEPGDPEAKQIIEQEFSGSFTVDFVLSNPWWLRAVINKATASGTSPTTHTFSGFPGDPMQIKEGNQQTSTYRKLEGCVAATATITFNIPGTVDVSLEGAYGFEDDTISSFTQPTLNERALSFHDARLNRDSSDLSFVQELTITINLNPDMILELGDRFPVDYSPKQRNTTIDYARIVQNTDDQQRAYGNASTLQSKVENTVDFFAEATNGKTGSDKNLVKLEMSNVFPDSVSRTGIGDGTADLQDELSEMSPDISATAENGTASPR